MDWHIKEAIANSVPHGGTGRQHYVNGRRPEDVAAEQGMYFGGSSGGPFVPSREDGSFDKGLDAMIHSADEANRKNEELWRESLKWNAAEAQKNRDWQKMMSDTAHQREIADLRAAGLNPILTATGGSGASSPGGSAASAGALQVDSTFSPGMYSAHATNANEQRRMKLMERKYQELELGMMKENLLNMRSQRELNSANALKLVTDAQSLGALRESMIRSNNSLAGLHGLQGQLIGPQAAIMEGLVPLANIGANGARKVADVSQAFINDFEAGYNFTGAHTSGGRGQNSPGFKLGLMARKLLK